MDIINIINEEILSFITESYEDVGIDYVKNNKKKLDDYHDYLDKIVVNGITYLNFKPEYNPEGSYIWNQIKAFDNTDGTEVANASYLKERENSRLNASIDVRPDMRRKGIASQIYMWIEKLTSDKLYPDVPHSQSATKFWANPNRTFGYDK